MINRVTGEVSFRSGLHLLLHHAIESPHKTQTLSLRGWKRHILGPHDSEHGTFEVEALSSEEDRVLIVLLAHQHKFYEPGTPMDSERRAYHEGMISTDLGGQREFSWGEVLCRYEATCRKDWLVVAYNRDAGIPLRDREVLLRLFAREKTPDEGA